MKKVVLETHNLRKEFGDVVAVDGISFPVYEGEVFGFLGPNGSGKTTTISMALGLIHPTAGSVELFGERVTPGHTAPLKRVGALVGTALVPYMSGRDNLALLARLYPEVGKERIEELLARVNLTHAADRPVKGYSTGMKQRLGLAAALLHEPVLLILDEPTNGLDPAGMAEIRNLIRSLADEGITVFLSSHLLHEVEQVCDRVAVLKQGQVVAQGPVAGLIGGEQQTVVRLRVSSPAAAQTALQALPEVSHIKTNGAYVEVTGAPSETLVAYLVGKGIVPGEVTTESSDLESVFLGLTK